MTESEPPRIFGILPTFRRQSLLADTLKKNLAQVRRPDWLIIVDNENSDETRLIVEEFRCSHPEVEVVFLSSAENLGSAGGWALGMKEAMKHVRDEDWILTLDDDDPPKNDRELDQMFRFALEQVEANPDLGAVGIVGARFNWRSGYLVRLPDHELVGAVEVDYVGSGHGAMYSGRVMREIGIFCTELFFGHTEIEYCLRLGSAGFRVLANGDLWMRRRSDAGRLGVTLKPNLRCEIKWQKYYVTRNYIYIMRQHRRLDLALKRAFIQTIAKPLVTLFASPRTAMRGLLLGGRASLDGFRGRMGRIIDPATFKGETKASS